MALINSNGKYIKLEADGNYVVYASEDARNRTKNSVSSDVVLAKYRELLIDLASQEEFRCYAPDQYDAIYKPLIDEYTRYEKDLLSHTIGNQYPIMAEIYPNVSDSIHEIIEAGCIIRDASESVDQAYERAKRIKRFGETTDA